LKNFEPSKDDKEKNPDKEKKEPNSKEHKSVIIFYNNFYFFKYFNLFFLNRLKI
jgi:hypothetical protein